MNALVEHETPRLPSLQSGGQVRAIVPQDFEGAWRIATAVCKAGMAPKGLDTPEKAMVAIMHGMEVGMTPMAALQSIAVVNGRPTIWGDGAIGLVRGSGKCEWIKERIEGEGDKMVAICEAKRKGEADPLKGRFSIDDAKKAGLWGKSGPWQQYPKRMLSMRARAFALRDGFADVLRGLGIAEEVQDHQPIREVTPATAQRTPPKPPAPPAIEQEEQPATVVDAEVETTVEQEDFNGDITENGEIVDDTAFFKRLEEDLAVAQDEASIEEVWTEADPMARFEGDETSQSIAMAIEKRALKRIGG